MTEDELKAEVAAALNRIVAKQDAWERDPPRREEILALWRNRGSVRHGIGRYQGSRKQALKS